MVESWNKMVLLSVDTSITLCNLQEIAFGMKILTIYFWYGATQYELMYQIIMTGSKYYDL